MSFHTHRNLFPTFSSASSSVSEHSLGRGSCAGVFLQLFDWNCRRKRRFRRKSLPAERLSPILKNSACRDENALADGGSAVATTGNENNEMLCTTRASSHVAPCQTPERKKKRSPNVVAKLMGLETMPSPELLSKRKPLNAWNPNSMHNSKISYQTSADSSIFSFRMNSVKHEERIVDIFREKQCSSKDDSQYSVVKSRDERHKTRVHDGNSPLMSMLSPSCNKDSVKGSISSPSKVYKPIVSPIRRSLTFKNSIPAPHIQCRRAHGVGEPVTSSTSAESVHCRNRKVKADINKTAQSNPSLDTGWKRQCLSEHEGKISKERGTAPSVVTSSKRQRRSHHDHISTQSALKQVPKSRNEKPSVQQTESKKKEYIPSGSNASSRNEEIIVQRLVQGKCVDGKNYGKCHHNDYCLSEGSKPKTSTNLHQKSGRKAESSRFLTAKSRQDQSRLKGGLTKSRNQRQSSTSSVARLDSCSYENDDTACISGKETGFIEDTEVKEDSTNAEQDPSSLFSPSLWKDSDGISSNVKIAAISLQRKNGMSVGESTVNIHENVGLLKEKPASDINTALFRVHDLNEPATSCITEDVCPENLRSTPDSTMSTVNGEQCSSRGNASILPESHEDADGMCSPGARTFNNETRSHSNIQDTYQSTGNKSSIEDVEDTASSCGKMQPVSYSGKSTATILQELLMALNLSMKRTSLDDDAVDEISRRTESGLRIDASVNSVITTGNDFDVSADNHRHGVQPFSDSRPGFSDDAKEVTESSSNGKHTLRECDDQCWYESPLNESASDFFRVPASSTSTDRSNEDNCNVFFSINSEMKDIVQSEEEYVKYIVDNAHLSPCSVYSARLGLSAALIEPGLLFELEKDANKQWRWGLDGICTSDLDMCASHAEATRAYRRLIFDCVTEALELDIGVHKGNLQQITLPAPSSTHLSIGVHRKIVNWRSMKCRMNVDDMVEISMNTADGKWLDFCNEVCEIAMDVESDVLTDLIDELLSDVSTLKRTFPQKQTCRTEGIRKEQSLFSSRLIT